MCTALVLSQKQGETFFGRNMDLEYNFNQSVHIVPRGYECENVVTGEKLNTKYAIIAMGTLMEGHPMLADGANEKGLACAGLNFYGYACYEEKICKEKVNLAPHDIILWILANFEKVEDVKEAIQNINIVNAAFNKNTPIATLHWIVTDKSSKSIVIEKTREGLKVFDNPVGVLTNSPTFDWHLTNLRQYMYLTPEQPQDTKWNKATLTPLGQGIGTAGMPGDFSTTARFIRAAFIKSHIPNSNNTTSTISEFFHILSNVAMISGTVITPEGKMDITQYTSCIDLKAGIYYYSTYNSHRIIAIDMNKENLNSSEIKSFPYLNELEIINQN